MKFLIAILTINGKLLDKLVFKLMNFYVETAS